MPDIDIARLRRLRGAVHALVLRSENSDMSSGMPTAYMSLRSQVIETIPDGLSTEFTALCPPISTNSPSGVTKIKLNGDSARSRLILIDGWLEALTDPKGS